MSPTPTASMSPKVSGGVTERSRLLAQLTDTLESVKSEMEERGEQLNRVEEFSRVEQ